MNDQGIAITYLYDIVRSSSRLAKDLLSDKDISLEIFDFLDSPRKDAIFTYQKRK